MRIRIATIVFLTISLSVIVDHFVLGQSKMEQQRRIILAVGGHAGDMEISCGAVLAKQARLGDRVVLLHLTLGEGGNPKMSPEDYGKQKHDEALAAAKIIGAEVIFGPYKDGELPNDEAARRYVADVIRQVKPTHIITHWKNSIHKDHSNAHAITTDAILLAALAGVKSEYTPHRGVKSVYFAENWEDPEGFHPYIYINVSEDQDVWEKSVTQYEFIRGGISRFPYLEYYKSLGSVRGGESGYSKAVAFEIDPFGKKRIMETIP
jgi:LmbE family N-acetylglucosaminyl deacetylase